MSGPEWPQEAPNPPIPPTKPPTGGSAWLEEFLSYLDGRGYSLATGIAYSESIHDFERRMKLTDHAATTIRDLDRYAGRLSLAGLAVNTRRRRLHALRSFYGYLFTRQLINTDPSRELQVPRPKNTSSPIVLTSTEVERLIFGCSPQPKPRAKREPKNNFERRSRLHPLKVKRDTALLALVYSQALRASEPGLMLQNDVQTSGRRRLLILRGAKRSTEPEVLELDFKVQEALDFYLAELSRAAIVHPALFPPLTRRKEGRTRGVTSDQVRAILAGRLKALGIRPGQRITVHTLKRSRATHAYESKAPMMEIQSLLRHGSLATTERYIRTSAKAVIQRRNFRSLPWNARRFGAFAALGERD